jgi:hypothetical protein
MALQGDLETVRYVIFDEITKRPISQGTCQRRDFPLVCDNLPAGQCSKILVSQDHVDLEPYDVLLDPEAEAPDGLMAYLAGVPVADGKTVDDAVTTIDDLDTESE